MNEKTQNLDVLFSGVREYYSPRIVGEVNDVFIKIVKARGQDIPWHTHDNEDEMFLVVNGTLILQMENREDITINAGEFFIVSRGVRHRVYCEQECRLLLIENKTAQHTGNVKSKITRSIEEQR